MNWQNSLNFTLSGPKTLLAIKFTIFLLFFEEIVKKNSKKIVNWQNSLNFTLSGPKTLLAIKFTIFLLLLEKIVKKNSELDSLNFTLSGHGRIP